MDIWTLIVGAVVAIATIVGIVAGIVQVMDYLQKRRERSERKPVAQPPATLPTTLDTSTHDDHSLHAEAGGDAAIGDATIEKQYGGVRVGQAEQVIVMPPPPASPEKTPPAPAIPSNLPSRSEFIGREREMALVREALASRAFLVCIDGIGGIGKTALALEVAHACLKEGVYAGVVWTSAKDRELTLGDVLDTVARTLDYPGVAQQPLAEKRDSVRRLLQSKPYLLVVDNFETVTDDAVRGFLLDMPEPSKALVTSRRKLALDNVSVVSLLRLEQTEALILIRSEGRRLGLSSVEQAEDRVLLRLYEATGGAPLALKWAVGQIKQRGQSLDTVLAALHEAKGDIFEAMFTRSWSLLAEEARRVLLVMPIFAASASRAAIEAASDVHHFVLDDALGQLVQMSLVDASDELDTARRRYSVHPLTRTFAQARLQETPDLEREAWERATRYFIRFAQANKVTLSRQEGAASLQTDLPNLLAVAEWCYQTNRLIEFIELVEAIDPFLWVYGYYDDWIRLGVMLTKAAQRTDNPRLAAEWAVWVLGWAYYQQDALDNAELWYRKGLETFEQLGDERWIAIAERQLAHVFRERGDYEEAERLLNHALAIFKDIEAPSVDVSATYVESPSWWRTQNVLVNIDATFRSLGELAYRKGNHSAARDYYEKSLEVVRATGDKEGFSHSCYYLGLVALKTGQLEEAQALFQASLATAEETRRFDLKAHAQRGMALLMEIQTEYESALTQAREVLATYERRGMRRGIRETRALIERLEARVEGKEGGEVSV